MNLISSQQRGGVLIKREMGYTVIELVIVLILVSIFAVLVVPRWARSPNVDAEAQALLARLRYTQVLSMTHGERFRVNFILPNAYGITNVNGVTVPDLSNAVNMTTLSSGVTLSLSSNLPNNVVAFDEQGIPYVDGAAKIPLSDHATMTLSAGNDRRTIIIAPQTGSMATTS